MVNIIDRTLLDQVSDQAQKSARLRKNHNFHPSDDFPSHRLLNGMEPGSYIRPHCHQHASKDESIVLLRGKVGIVAFDEGGNIIQKSVLSPCSDAVAVDIPHGVFHTLVCLEPGTVFFEAKAGPYAPLLDAEKGKWAPDEGSTQAPDYLRTLEKVFI